MTTDIAAITFSCQDPRKVAEFWAHALGRHVAATADSGSAAILAAIPLYFRRSESQTTGENNIHLDLSTDGLDAEATRLRELGATEVRRNQWHSTESITFLDIEGNQFDLIAE
jgi:predicted enzyme related to lactoylglutathione lyase